MKDMGIDADQASAFMGLAKILGGDINDLTAAFKGHADKAKNYGYPISGFEAAVLMNYSASGYTKVNPALRDHTWSQEMHMYAKLGNEALQKMPKSDEKGLIRNTSLTPEQIKYYADAAGGGIIQEKAFMSTSNKKPNGVFSGNVRFIVDAKGKRGANIKQLSHHGTENEILFAAKTYFKVHKLETLKTPLSTGATTVIHLEEWEHI
jgi:hypothetical protein